MEGNGDKQPWDGRLLLLNLCLTQVLVVLLAVGLLLVQGRLGVGLWTPAGVEMWVLGLFIGLTVVGLDGLVYRFLPRSWTDDGGLNRMLFEHMPVGWIAIVALSAALAEELLFRGAIQYWLGIVGSSLLFTLIHFRYLKKWLLVLMVFGISLVFGWMTDFSGSLVPAMCAHFVIDFLMGLLIRYGKVG